MKSDNDLISASLDMIVAIKMPNPIMNDNASYTFILPPLNT